jgi:hypothetical protein
VSGVEDGWRVVGFWVIGVGMCAVHPERVLYAGRRSGGILERLELEEVVKMRRAVRLEGQPIAAVRCRYDAI